MSCFYVFISSSAQHRATSASTAFNWIRNIRKFDFNPGRHAKFKRGGRRGYAVFRRG